MPTLFFSLFDFKMSLVNFFRHTLSPDALRNSAVYDALKALSPPYNGTQKLPTSSISCKVLLSPMNEIDEKSLRGLKKVCHFWGYNMGLKLNYPSTEKGQPDDQGLSILQDRDTRWQDCNCKC